jgi:hypothetical protein
MFNFFNKHNAHKEIFLKDTKIFSCIIFHYSLFTFHFYWDCFASFVMTGWKGEWRFAPTKILGNFLYWFFGQFVNWRYNNVIPSGFFDFGCFYYAIILPSLRDFWLWIFLLSYNLAIPLGFLIMFFLINAIKGRIVIRPYLYVN